MRRRAAKRVWPPAISAGRSAKRRAGPAAGRSAKKIRRFKAPTEMNNSRRFSNVFRLKSPAGISADRKTKRPSNPDSGSADKGGGFSSRLVFAQRNLRVAQKLLIATEDFLVKQAFFALAQKATAQSNMFGSAALGSGSATSICPRKNRRLRPAAAASKNYSGAEPARFESR